MATLEKELMVTTKNETGALTKVLASLAEAKVNVWAFCGWTEGDNANFVMLTDNNTKALELWNTAGYTARENEVVVFELDNTPGTLWNATQKLTTAGVDCNYMYVSTYGDYKNARVILGTKDNAKALETLG